MLTQSAPKSGIQTEPSSLGWTNEAGEFTYNDTSPTHQLVPGTAGEVSLWIRAISPSIAPASDPNDLRPQYAVLPDQGAILADGSRARSPNTWYSNAFNACFAFPITQAQAAQSNAALTASISGNYSPNAVAFGGPPDLVRDAFAAFTVLDTYHTYACDLGINLSDPLPVFFFPTSATASYLPKYGVFLGTTGIFMRQSCFNSDAKALGHEFGHYAASEASIYNPVGGDHTPMANQRLKANPSAGDAMTLADDQLAFNEGFATWFGVSGAVCEPVVVLCDIPGFGAPQSVSTHTLLGMSLDAKGGGGEDEELSVARILWALESDPMFAGATPLASAKNVYNAAKGAWLNMTDGATPFAAFGKKSRRGLPTTACSTGWPGFSRRKTSPHSRTYRTRTPL